MYMNVSVIIIEDSENYREIIKNFLERNDISVLATYPHKEFIEQKPELRPDIALVSFRTNVTYTKYTIDFLKTFYKTVKIALLVSLYDTATKQELETLPVDGGMRKADDSFELLYLLDQVLTGEKYLTY